MPKQPTNIRDLREFKQLSQDAVAAAAGVTYSRFVRIEEGSGKTTPEEVAQVMAALQAMEPGTRKLAGRPFKDANKQAAVAAARASGTSVAEAMGATIIAPAKAKPVRKPKSDMAAALKKPRVRKPKAS